MGKEYLVVVSAKVTTDLKNRMRKLAKQSDLTLSEFIGGVLFQDVMEKTVAKQHDNLRRGVGVK